MFAAVFRMTALINSDGQGQRVFGVSEREAPAHDAQFLSRLAALYQQEVSTILRSWRPAAAFRAKSMRPAVPPESCRIEVQFIMFEQRGINDHI